MTTLNLMQAERGSQNSFRNSVIRFPSSFLIQLPKLSESPIIEQRSEFGKHLNHLEISVTNEQENRKCVVGLELNPDCD